MSKFKSIEACLAIQTPTNEQVSQSAAGAIPQFAKASHQPVWIRLDATTPEELMYKYLFNAAAILVKAQESDNDFSPKLVEIRNRLKDIVWPNGGAPF